MSGEEQPGESPTGSLAEALGAESGVYVAPKESTC
jgi:hypothetical protein